MYESMYAAEPIKQLASFCGNFQNFVYAGNHYKADLDNNSGPSTAVIAKWQDDANRPAVIR